MVIWILGIIEMQLFIAIVLLITGCGGFVVDHSDDDWPEHCPDPDDPDVDYYHESYQNMLFCEQADFSPCPSGTKDVPQECGCGCMSTFLGGVL